MLNLLSVKRLVTIATAAVLAAAAVATLAVGKVREYGLEPSPRPTAACPGDPCRATGRVTGIQVQNVRNGKSRKYPTEVKRNGWLVGFSVTLGRPNRAQRTFFNRLWGSPATARISILRPAPTKKYPRNRIKNYRLMGHSKAFELNEYFGTKAWFTLHKRLHVRRKDLLALTLPTWAPVLAIGTEEEPMLDRERWRGSRKHGRCNSPGELARHREHVRVGSETRYRCLYTKARLLYTALVIDKPKPPKR